VKSIDLDTSGSRLIQSVSAQSRAVSTKNIDDVALVIQKSTTDQIADLLSLVRNAPTQLSENERINQIVQNIGDDSYSIDFEALADNIFNEF